MSDWINGDDVVRFEECRCVRATAKALLVDIPEVDEELWIPKSVVGKGSEVSAAGDEGELVLKQWWAQQEGLE